MTVSVEREAETLAVIDQLASGVKLVIGVNYFCRLATTILAGPTGGSRGVKLGGIVVVAG